MKRQFWAWIYCAAKRRWNRKVLGGLNVKITDVKIDGFGIWSNLSVRRLSGDVTVFYGPNEAGKTTLMQFMRTVLYGFSRERRGRYLPPVHGGHAGGLLELSSPRGNYEVRRHLGHNDAPQSLGHLELLDEGGSPLGTHQLSAILGGVDESIFTNVFAIGLKEMQELGALNDSAAADHLYKLTSGLDRVSLIDVVRDLASARKDLSDRDEGSATLPRLLQRKDKLQAEIEELATRGRRWPQLLAERQTRSEEIDRIERSMSDLQRQTHHYDVLLSARDKWTQRRALEDQLTSLGAVADLPANALEQVDTINARLRKLKRRLLTCRQQRTALREELAKHVCNRNLLTQAGRIQALGEHAPWITSLEEEVARLTADTVALEREIEARRPQMDTPAGTSRSKLPEITSKTLSLLREPATRLNHLLKLVQRTQQEASAVKQRSEQALQRVSSELQDLDESSLSAALEKAGARVAQLRRRIQVEERIEQLNLQHNDLEGESNELFDGQVMPLERMIWLFSSFVLSSVLILAGVFGGMLWGLSWFLGLMMTFMGFVGLGASIVWKLDWERNAEREWQSCERQLEMLEQQLAEAKTERSALDEQLPTGGGPLDARLAHAERQLQQLEQLAPMDAQRHESGQHVDAAERRATKASEDLKDARRNWQTALKAVALPETLSPHDVRQLARGFRTVISIRKQVEQRRDDLDARRREFAALAGRINELFVELGIVADSDSPPAQLKQLATVLVEQQQIAERRREVQRQLKQWHGRYRQASKGFDFATRQRRLL
ncbi:MAG: AAA family ATPase, partial [Planctomycetota bacterium]